MATIEERQRCSVASSPRRRAHCFSIAFVFPCQRNGNKSDARPRAEPNMRPTQVLSKTRLFRSVALALFLYSEACRTNQLVSGSNRMIRLCIASVDPTRLSSQCVMCDRREFPITAIDCTGINKMHDLIANPLSVEDATCLIYNCRKRIPYIRPEPYHGSISQAVRATPQASGSSNFQMPAPFGVGDGDVGMYPPMGYAGSSSHYSSASSPFQMAAGGGGGGGGGFGLGSSPLGRPKEQPLPYAVVPAMQITPFGLRKYRNALIPLFR